MTLANDEDIVNQTSWLKTDEAVHPWLEKKSCKE